MAITVSYQLGLPVLYLGTVRNARVVAATVAPHGGTPSAVRRSQDTAILQRAEWREVGDRSTRRCERCWSEVRRYSQDRGRRATTDEVLADDEVPQVDGVEGESQRRFARGFGAPADYDV